MKKASIAFLNRPLILTPFTIVTRIAINSFGFLMQGFQSLGLENFGLTNQLEPILRFVQFLKCTFDLADEISIRLCALSLAILSTR